MINVQENQKLMLDSDHCCFCIPAENHRNWSGTDVLKRPEAVIRSTETENPHIPAQDGHERRRRRQDGTRRPALLTRGRRGWQVSSGTLSAYFIQLPVTGGVSGSVTRPWTGARWRQAEPGWDQPLLAGTPNLGSSSSRRQTNGLV